MIEGVHVHAMFQAMARSPKQKPPTRTVQNWRLLPAATLGSSVRAKGILLEIRAQLPPSHRKLLNLESGALLLEVPESDSGDYRATAELISSKLVGIEALHVIPREVEDILSIKPAERLRWLKDGRLPSAGTKTVKLRGRARKITFHVFDPRHIEDILDRNMAEIWREEDALASAENRRRGARKAALKRAAKHRPPTTAPVPHEDASPEPSVPSLSGWDDFDLDGLLR